jgi:GT2 family glycosyltransferase
MTKTSSPTISLAVLMTCHNRKDKTLACLRSLFKSEQLNDLENKVSMMCYLVDDGSTDGTSVAVKEHFPQVHVIIGSGELYWNQGMRLAWNKALSDKGYDYYLWLNDDVTLYDNAITQLLNSFQSLTREGHNIGAMVGTLQDPKTQLASYGGRSIRNPWFPLNYTKVMEPTTQEKKCDYINGNCTLISAKSVVYIGILSSEFSHSMGDFDYGLRLRKKGFTCWISSIYVGQCINNQYKAKFKDKNLSLSTRITLIKNPSILPPPDEWMFYVKRHAGIFWPVYYLKAYLRKILPIFWVL